MSNCQSPKVSIVLPTYNGSKYIRQSIDSCLNQTFKDFELIIIDDCSTDNTSEIIKSYTDPRIRYIRNQQNQRLPRSLNIGFEQARGKYLTWTSDDNIYAAQAIEKMLNFLVEHQYEFVFCDYYTFDYDNLQQATLVRLPSIVAFDKINPIRACFLYTRNVKEVTGDYDPEKELGEDYEYWIRVSLKFTMNHYSEPLYYYRVHKAQLYSSRFWEVEVVKLLVRLQYSITDMNEITRQFTELIAQKRKLFPCLNRTLTRYLCFKQIYKMLLDFKTGQIDFLTVKQDLHSFIDSRFIKILIFSVFGLLTRNSSGNFTIQSETEKQKENR